MKELRLIIEVILCAILVIVCTPFGWIGLMIIFGIINAPTSGK